MPNLQQGDCSIWLSNHAAIVADLLLCLTAQIQVASFIIRVNYSVMQNTFHPVDPTGGRTEPSQFHDR
jgi:hypothetical protein